MSPGRFLIQLCWPGELRKRNNKIVVVVTNMDADSENELSDLLCQLY